jgi:hypothetical protein
VDGGLTPDDAVTFGKALKDAGLDYIDVSSGSLAADIRTPTSPGYNASIAERLRREIGIVVRTVGMITTAEQAEAIRRRQGRHGRVGARLPRQPALGLARGASTVCRRRPSAAIPAVRAKAMAGRGFARVTMEEAAAAVQGARWVARQVARVGGSALKRFGEVIAK